MEDGFSLLLIARNKKGYENLCRLITEAYRSGREAPSVSYNALRENSLDLICLTGGRGTLLRSLAEKNLKEKAEKHLLELKSIFDEGSLFIELQNNYLPSDQRVQRFLLGLSHSLSIPVVATNNVAYLTADGYEVHRVLVGIAREHHKRPVKPLPNNSFHLLSTKEAFERFSNKEAIYNTQKIADMVQLDLPLGTPKPPRIYKNENEAFSILYRECLLAIARRKYTRPEYIKRLEREMNLIGERGLADFFLLAKKVRDFAEKRNIRCTVRGSAAGSLVVHLLLGGVDPVEHNLLFERFINYGRFDLPDVDLDFDSDRRDEVIRFVFESFPESSAMVSTILSFRSRGAIRCTAKALGYSLDEIAKLTRGIPYNFTLLDEDEALRRYPELKSHPIWQKLKLLTLARAITGLPFAASVHLGGVVIADGPLIRYSPVVPSAKGVSVVQMDKEDVEAFGLLKLDLLGLRMHTAIRKTLESLKRQGIEIDVDNLSLDDKKTYELLKRGDTLGVFQLESPGQRQLVVRLKPERFSHIIAEVSLFRPGPVEGNMVSPYVLRKNGRQKVSYPHPSLKPILEETYGVILFQEQVLRIAHVVAGMEYCEADAFRRAMTRDRSPEEMEKLKERFITGALKRGYSRETAEEIFRMVTSFAAYGFCKAHAASFAHITYKSAYLKAHYPREFYIGLLNAGCVGSYPSFVVLNEARRKGIPIYPPHVNYSFTEYVAEGEGIRVPLTQVRSVGRRTAELIVAEREKNGRYTSIEDFRSRTGVNRRILKKLLVAGAFEGLKEKEHEPVLPTA